MKKFLQNYREEIKLIDRVGFVSGLEKLPLLYLAGITNGFSILFVWLISYFFYQTFLLDYIQLSLLSFNYFRLTLLVFLLITGMYSGLGVSYFLYWRVSRKL